jgi:hypothetical protein
MAAVPALCPSCHAAVHADSVYCSQCGRLLVDTSAEAETVLAVSGQLGKDPQPAIDACNDFLRRWPDRPEARDVRLTLEVCSYLATVLGLDRGPFSWAFQSPAELEQACRLGVPPRLANGLLATTQVAEPAGRRRIVEALGHFRSIEAAVLRPLFDEAAAETSRLMPDGRIPAQVQGISYEDAMRDAELHADSLDKGDVGYAEKGFRYLKSINPKLSVVRLMLAKAVARQGRVQEAMRELLYCYSLAPDELESAVNLAWLLAGLHFHAAAHEVVKHYRSLCPNVHDAKLDGLEALCRAVVSAALAQAAHSWPDQIDPAAPDALASLDVVPHPWLATPQEQPGPPLDQARIFISYRRRGAHDLADKLQRALKARHPAMHVFRDETHIDGGEDFVKRLAVEVDHCDLMVALIDTDWAAILKSDPECVVAREIGRARERFHPVIPMLVDDTPMPTEADLPPSLKGFSHTNALRLTMDDIQNGVDWLESAAAKALAHVERRQEKAMAEFDDELKKMEADASAPHPLIDELRASVDRVIVIGEVHGLGVPRGGVAFAGDWECTATVPGMDAIHHVHFTAHEDPQTFTGKQWTSPAKGLMSWMHLKRSTIHGSWAPVVDSTQAVLLGIKLDCLDDEGRSFVLPIPMHRRVGSEFVGEAPNGTVWVSRLVRPMQPTL